jgi:hypothetical protein
MKKLIIICFISFAVFTLKSQCLMLNESSSKSATSATIDDWSFYSGYNSDNTPVKYVRVTLHVFLKSNGTGNFPDNATSRDWLTNFFWPRLNAKYSSTEHMALPTTSPYYIDTRIQFVLAGIYFWNDDKGWDLYCPGSGVSTICHITDGTGANLYQTYVVNNANMTNKYNSVHVFLGENQTGMGRASGIGDKKYIVMSGMYTKHLNGNNWWQPANLLAHELGHSIGLRHTWNGNDGCDDTPQNNCGWDPDPSCTVQTNNMMDYNPNMSALTQCQINMAHYYLLGNAGNINDCVQSGISVTEPTIGGANIICPSGTNNTLNSMQFGETASWSVTPSINVIKSSGFGTNINLTPMGTSNSNVTLTVVAGFGKSGTKSISKNLVLNKLNSNHTVCGNLSGTYSGRTLTVLGASCSTQPAVIPANTKTSLIATQAIIINAGFQVENSGEFEAIISPNCP